MEKLQLLSLGKIADPEARARIAAICDIVETDDISEAGLLARIAGFDAVIVPFTSSMLVTRKVIDAAPRLRLIASSYGGTRQNIEDLYALSKGITVIHTGASRERPMAEYTLGLILSSPFAILYSADALAVIRPAELGVGILLALAGAWVTWLMGSKEQN